jgi:hypothetical protein
MAGDLTASGSLHSRYADHLVALELRHREVQPFAVSPEGERLALRFE